LPEKCVFKISKMPELYIILAKKLSKYPNFYDICPKIYKIPEFYMIFCPENARILHNCPKNIFPEF